MPYFVTENVQSGQLDETPRAFDVARSFSVYADELEELPIDPNVIRLLPDIPKRGDEWTTPGGTRFPLVKVKNVSVVPLSAGPRLWQVEVEYGYPDATITAPSGIQVHWNIGTASQKVYKDADGNSIGDETDRRSQFGTPVLIPTIELLVEMPLPWAANPPLWVAFATMVNSQPFPLFMGAFAISPGFVQYLGPQARFLPEQVPTPPFHYRIVHRFRAGQIVAGGQTRGLAYHARWNWEEVEVADPLGGPAYRVRRPKGDPIWHRMYDFADLNVLLS